MASLRFAAGLLVTIGACACGAQAGANATVSPPATSRSSAAAATAATPSETPTTTDTQRLCRVDTEGGGSYYLLVTSTTEHDFRACDGATAYSGTTDTLLTIPGMARTCVLSSSSSVVQYHATVAVYSDTSGSDQQVAQAFCASNNGTSG